MATNGADGPSVFSVFIEQPPVPAEPTPQATSPEVRRILDWLQNNWKRPVICARDFQIYGPPPYRDKASMTKLTEILVKRGWLIPLKTHRYDRKKWQITIGPE
jgi:hypothetical protein